MKGLAYWRSNRGITQRELAEMTGLSIRTISNFESTCDGLRKTSMDNVLKICKVLNIELDDLEGLYEL